MVQLFYLGFLCWSTMKFYSFLHLGFNISLFGFASVRDMFPNELQKISTRFSSLPPSSSPCHRPASHPSFPLSLYEAHGKVVQCQGSAPEDHQGTEYLPPCLPPFPAGSFHTVVTRRLLYLPAPCLYSREEEGDILFSSGEECCPMKFCLGFLEHATFITWPTLAAKDAGRSSGLG